MGTIFGKGHEENDLYVLNGAPHIASIVQHFSLPLIKDNSSSSISLDQWHQRLGSSFFFSSLLFIF